MEMQLDNVYSGRGQMKHSAAVPKSWRGRGRHTCVLGTSLGAAQADESDREEPAVRARLP